MVQKHIHLNELYVTSNSLPSSTDTRSDLIVPPGETQRVIDVIRESNEFTLMARFRQRLQSVGPLISLADNHAIFLELQSNSNRNGLSLTYQDNHGREQIEYFDLYSKYSLRIDDNWHRVAMSISGIEVQVFYDCHSIYKRSLPHLPDRNFSASNMKLYVGQRNLRDKFFFKVRMAMLNMES